MNRLSLFYLTVYSTGQEHEDGQITEEKSTDKKKGIFIQISHLDRQ